MSFFSIFIALLIEQIKPLINQNIAYQTVRDLAHTTQHNFNAGQFKHGVWAWCALTVPLVLATLAVYLVCLRINPLLALAWNFVVVYCTLGFRQFSHWFTSIQHALSETRVDDARAILNQWIGRDTTHMPQSDVARITIERALVACHRHVFGVFFWFLMPLGPAGAVLYRTAEYLSRRWGNSPEDAAFGQFAKRAFYLIDWLPVRLSALAFAVVGNFEDAIYSWRNFASQFSDESEGVLLSAGGGALGVRLGETVVRADNSEVTELDAETLAAGAPLFASLGDEANVRSLHSAVGLVWRALVLWMLLLLMLSIAVWVG